MSSEPSIFFSDVNERQGSFLRRTFVLGGLTTLGGLALTGRLAQLQVIQAGQYATMASNNQFNFRLVPPPRGRILDRDGVVIATTLKDDYPDDWSLVLAHELGHFLGLNHTVEGNLGVYDNIADTDEENPVDYLMYPNVSESRSTRVTRDQGWVVRRHPAVRPR